MIEILILRVIMNFAGFLIFIQLIIGNIGLNPLVDSINSRYFDQLIILELGVVKFHG